MTCFSPVIVAWGPQVLLPCELTFRNVNIPCLRAVELWVVGNKPIEFNQDSRPCFGDQETASFKTKKKWQGPKLFEVVFHKERCIYTERTGHPRFFRDSETADGYFQLVSTSLRTPNTHLEIIERHRVEFYFIFSNLAYLWWECVCVRNKRALGA